MFFAAVTLPFLCPVAAFTLLDQIITLAMWATIFAHVYHRLYCFAAKIQNSSDKSRHYPLILTQVSHRRRMWNVMKGRNFHHRRSTTCGGR
jgi:hypothetical protein